jgi:hypothetical protein
MIYPAAMLARRCTARCAMSGLPWGEAARNRGLIVLTACLGYHAAVSRVPSGVRV